jgi:hypothetical protein
MGYKLGRVGWGDVTLSPGKERRLIGAKQARPRRTIVGIILASTVSHASS